MAATLTISLSALLLPVPTTAQATLPPLENLEPQLADERVLGPLDAPRGEIERSAKARAILEDSLGNAPETDPRIEEARAILEDQLVDYAGARFKNMHIVETGEALTLCGEVNAPNRLGGMSGWQKTAVILRGRDYAPMMQVSTDGFTGLSEYRDYCPKHAEDAARTSGEDLAAYLQPVATGG